MFRLPCVRIAAVAFACSVLAACGSSAAPSPAGWTKTGPTSWSKAGQTYQLAVAPYADSITDLANQESVDTLLTDKGLVYDGSVPYPGCEGFGGLMTFRRLHPLPKRVILLAFMVSDGNSTVVTYERGAGQPEDPTASSAMHHTICHV